VQLTGWQDKEIINKEAKGIELYAPLHDYIYQASGLFHGEIEALIDFRQKISLHSAGSADLIKLEFDQ
jgi:hypothetical protein